MDLSLRGTTPRRCAALYATAGILLSGAAWGQIAPAWIAESGQAGTQFGYSVAPAGDVNGDGYGDVVVGAPTYAHGEDREGGAMAFYGSPEGPSLTPDWSVESDQVQAEFGLSVAGAGDVNGDGFDDVIIGAHFYDSGQSNEGKVFVYYGSSTGLSAAPDWTAESNQVFAFFGYSVAGAGDVNADGYDDVIVGARFYDRGHVNEGAAFVYHGSPVGLRATPNWVGESNDDGSDYGCAVASAGDVNGDGYGDVVVGARKYNGGSIDEGGAFVYHGSASGLAATPAWLGESNQGDGQFGNAVGAAGDVNNDGYGDLIVGAYRYDNGETNEGRAYAYYGSASGLLSTPSWLMEGNQNWAYFGFGVAGAGDINADGYDDVLVGASWHDGIAEDEGAAFLYYGSGAGLTTQEAFAYGGGQFNAGLGWSVARGGDVNGDGYDDFLIGAELYDNGEADEGRAYAFYGGAAGVVIGPTPPMITTDGGNGPGADFLTKLPIITIEGTKGSDGVAVLVNGSGAGVTIPGDLQWRYEAALHEGANLLVVLTVDPNGLTSVPDLVTVTLDTTAPPAPVVTTDGGNGPGEDFTTNAAAFTLEGTTAAETSALLVNGSADGVAYTPGQTGWSYSGVLGEGANPLSIVAMDDGDNASPETTLTITLDTVPPPAPVITTNGGQGPGEDFVTNLESLALQGTTTVDSVAIEVNGASGGVTYQAGMSNWSYAATLIDGFNSFEVVAIDAAGNASEAATLTVELDLNLLGTPLILTDGGHGPGVDFSTSEAALLLEGTTDPAAHAVFVNASPNGVAFATGSSEWSYRTTLAEGPNLIEVTAVNTEGRASLPATIVVTLDTTPPAPPTIATDGGNGPGANFATTASLVALEGNTGSDAARIEVNGTSDAVVHTPGETTWSYSGELTEDENVFLVTAADALGNTSAPAQLVVTRDTTPPAAPAITTDGGNGPGANFASAETALTLEGTMDTESAAIRINGSQEGVTLDRASGTWRIDVALLEGPNSFQVTACDALGNESDATAIVIVHTTETPTGKSATNITLASAQTEVLLGETLQVTGTLHALPPLEAKILTGRVIQLEYRLAGNVLATRSTVVLGDNRFEDSYVPAQWGAWTVRAQFQGDDELHPSGWSEEVGIAVLDLISSRGADINGDGVVNALDIQLVINAALGLPIGERLSADVNKDSSVNSLDIQFVINAALGI